MSAFLTFLRAKLQSWLFLKLRAQKSQKCANKMRVRMSHLGSKSTHGLPEMGHSYTRRAEIGRSCKHAPTRRYSLFYIISFFTNSTLEYFGFSSRETQELPFFRTARRYLHHCKNCYISNNTVLILLYNFLKTTTLLNYKKKINFFRSIQMLKIIFIALAPQELIV